MEIKSKIFRQEKRIPSLEFCKRLKKLGYSQNADGLYFYRYYYDKPDEFWIDFKDKIAWEENPEFYYAPSITDFKEWLKQVSTSRLVLMQHDLRNKEDKQFLNAVLEEIKKRKKKNANQIKNR